MKTYRSDSSLRTRGLLLLELVIALAIFVTVGTLIMSTIRQALLSTRNAQDLLRAEDFASSVLAMVESGIESTDNLAGPLPEWDPETGYFDGAMSGASAMGFSSATEFWIIEIETAAAGVPGFTSIIVTVSREDRPGVVATRESLVPLTEPRALSLADKRRFVIGAAR